MKTPPDHVKLALLSPPKSVIEGWELAARRAGLHGVDIAIHVAEQACQWQRERDAKVCNDYALNKAVEAKTQNAAIACANAILEGGE